MPEGDVLWWLDIVYHWFASVVDSGKTTYIDNEKNGTMFDKIIFAMKSERDWYNINMFWVVHYEFYSPHAWQTDNASL